MSTPSNIKTPVFNKQKQFQKRILDVEFAPAGCFGNRSRFFGRTVPPRMVFPRLSPPLLSTGPRAVLPRPASLNLPNERRPGPPPSRAAAMNFAKLAMRAAYRAADYVAP